MSQVRNCRGSIQLGTGCRKCPRCIEQLGLTEKPKIETYNDLTKDQIEIGNRNKLIEELVMRALDKMVRNEDSREFDQRFVALARTYMQVGFMLMNRAVFKPKRLYEKSILELLQGIVAPDELEELVKLFGEAK